MASDEQIRELAYSIWQQDGCPEGKATEHYFRAKQILEAQESTTLKTEETPQLYSATETKPSISRKRRSRKSS